MAADHRPDPGRDENIEGDADVRSIPVGGGLLEDPDDLGAGATPIAPRRSADTSSPDERDRLIAEALAHAAAREAVYRRPLQPGAGWWKGALAGVLLVSAGVVALAPPAWLSGDPSPALEPASLERGARAALYLQARDIDAFRLTEGRLPADLEEVGGGLPGVRYVRSNDRVYQLVARGPNGRALVYDSARPDEAFQSAGAAVAGLDTGESGT